MGCLTIYQKKNLLKLYGHKNGVLASGGESCQNKLASVH
jgi:hypothetical protein